MHPFGINDLPESIEFKSYQPQKTSNYLIDKNNGRFRSAYQRSKSRFDGNKVYKLDYISNADQLSIYKQQKLGLSWLKKMHSEKSREDAANKANELATEWIEVTKLLAEMHREGSIDSFKIRSGFESIAGEEMASQSIQQWQTTAWEQQKSVLKNLSKNF